MNSFRPIGAALAILTGLCATASDVRASDRPGIATPDQIALDRLAVRILATPAVQAEKPALRALFLKDPQAATPAGRTRLDAAVNAMMFASIKAAINSDPDHPKIAWATTAPHRWGDIDIPGSGYGIDNPDNVYRETPIDGAARFEITGELGGDRPAQESFTLYRTRPGAAGTDKQAAWEGAQILGALTAKDLMVKPDGTFIITIDHDPANGRPNHIQSSDNRDEVLIVRDTLSDWSAQMPPHLAVKRVAGPMPGPELSIEALTDRSIALMRSMVPFWLKFDNDYIYSKAANTIEMPRKRDGGWGFAVMARFALEPDEALVVTLEPLGAAYLGFQIADPWSVTPDYIHHTASLNNHQAQPDPDGAFTYVIAPNDPGYPNWIDSEGMLTGLITLRWQELVDRSVPADRAIRSVRLVKLAELKSSMPRGMLPLSASERHNALSERARTYAHRLE